MSLDQLVWLQCHSLPANQWRPICNAESPLHNVRWQRLLWRRWRSFALCCVLSSKCCQSSMGVYSARSARYASLLIWDYCREYRLTWMRILRSFSRDQGPHRFSCKSLWVLLSLPVYIRRICRRWFLSLKLLITALSAKLPLFELLNNTNEMPVLTYLTLRSKSSPGLGSEAI